MTWLEAALTFTTVAALTGWALQHRHCRYLERVVRMHEADAMEDRKLYAGVWAAQLKEIMRLKAERVEQRRAYGVN